MRRENPGIQTLFAKLEERGIYKNILWEASRFNNGTTDVFFVAFSALGNPPAIGTALIIDYGPGNGFGVFHESSSIKLDDDVALIAEGPNGMDYLLRDLATFNKVMGVSESRLPQIVPGEVDLVKKLINEEHKETIDAIDADDLVEVADGLADLIYVCVQAARKFGIPLAKVWQAVQRSNMAKVDPETGRVRRRPEDGKILKPEGWQPPNIAEILEEARNGR